jgi:predicted AAA+ superfamily ATPase
MYGFIQRELEGRLDPGEPSFFDKLAMADARLFRLPSHVPDLPQYIELALHGAFPELVLQPRKEPVARLWLDSYLEQLLTRDAAGLAQVREPARFHRYFEAIALNSAGLVADKTLYSIAQINAKTAAAYEQLLVNLFVIEQVPAWGTNRLHRLVKTPKRYVVDPALIASGAGLTARAVLADGDLLGRMIDTFGLAQLRPEAALSKERCRMYHLRSEGGRHEVDLVIERDAGEIVAIEFKATSAPDAADANHLCWLREQMGDCFRAGAVLHTGPRIFEISDRVLAIPLCAIWG